MNICVISDGKQGHLSQTQGLAEALVRRATELNAQGEHRWSIKSVRGLSFVEKLFYRGELQSATKQEQIDLVLCAGHSTHLAALSLARYHQCLCMVCMKPSLPLSFFDLALIPEHDLVKMRRPNSKRIFPTKGALNNIDANQRSLGRHQLFLIGGPSREFDWDSEELINQIELITRCSKQPIILTTSRRTPTDFAREVHQACPSVNVVPLEETGKDWIREHLNTAHSVWVTQDSVSMVYEALSSGAPVGILDMPERERKHVSRVHQGLQQLIADGYVNSFTSWAQHRTLVQKPPLEEANRAARSILERFPQLV